MWAVTPAYPPGLLRCADKIWKKVGRAGEAGKRRVEYRREGKQYGRTVLMVAEGRCVLVGVPVPCVLWPAVVPGQASSVGMQLYGLIPGRGIGAQHDVGVHILSGIASIQYK